MSRHQADRSGPRPGVRGLGRERAHRRRQHHHEVAARGAGHDRVAERRRSSAATPGRPPARAPAGCSAPTPRSRAVAERSIWSYRVSAGYFNSDPLPRPTGRIPRHHRSARSDAPPSAARPIRPMAPGALGTAFENQGTSQPKFDVRVDQEIERRPHHLPGRRRRESEGIIHTGIGPFDIQQGSVHGLREGRTTAATRCKVNFFTNFIDAERAESPAARSVDAAAAAAELLDADLRRRGRRRLRRRARGTCSRTAATCGATTSTSPSRRAPRTAPSSAPTCRTRSSSTRPLHGRRPRGQVRQPERSGVLAAARGGLQADARPRRPRLVQPRVPIAVGHQQLPGHSASSTPTDLSGLAPLLPPPLRPLVAAPFPLVVRAVGSRLPIGTHAAGGADAKSR